MAIYTLEKGLVVRTGDAQWEVIRIIDGQYVQLEHQSTGRFRRERISKLTRDIGTGIVTVVHGSMVVGDQSPPDNAGIVFCAESLPEPHRKTYVQANFYVLAMRRRQISKGQRTRISKAIAAIAQVWRDNLDERRATNKMRMSRRG